MLGGLLGLVFGILVLGVIAWGIRLSGSFEEGVLRSFRAMPSKLRPELPESTETLIELKKFLDQTQVSSLLQKLDPLSPRIYAEVDKTGQLLSSPEAIERLWNAPEMQSLTRHPKIIALRQDPQIQESLRSGHFVSVLRHPKVQAVCNDTSILTTLSTLDLKAQIDKALNPKETPASPPKEPKEPPKAGKEPQKSRPSPAAR
jgi:hypothetical protein